jgi:predicted RNA binding protein with dsRBD fold (UPF0201 family)
MGSVKFEKIRLSNKTIIKRTFYGSIDVPEIIDTFHKLLEYDDIQNHTIKVIISDVSNAKLNFDLKKFKDLIAFIKNDAILSELKLAVIVDSPMKTIFPALASNIIGVKIKPFSTIEGAIKWAEIG